ncbi:MAG: ankyrin repeat domain-containing protein [Candidatus Eremiobacteraeota bacterium]|nr:ankyrin repeat domain-containing protein [Candidatus Eremiobacteraeota bacterium]
MPNLPARPSREHLRKAAKRLARDRSLKLAAAQHALASDYGFRTWADLMRHVDGVRGEPVPPLFAPVRAGDVDAVRALLANGANPRLGDGRETPLHLAARHGPAALVEALLEGGALEWQPDRKGRTALEVAQRARPRERAAIIALLDRSRIADPSFRAAVAAIHAGDTVTLGRLIDAEPRLLRERIREPEVYRRVKRFQYFLDPKLFWFIANNPTRVEHLPPNIAEVARVMIERGVDQDDLDYALGLTMTSEAARKDGVQRPLIGELIAAGARVTPETIDGTAAYHELDALRALIENGFAMTAPIAAALGELDALRELLRNAGSEEVQSAFALAVINGNVAAARLALDRGADVSAFLPVHAHSTALHQAAANDDPAMVELLLARGAQTDTLDTLWEGTPLGWAIYLDKPRARAALEAAER